jgi:uncharacterized protein
MNHPIRAILFSLLLLAGCRDSTQPAAPATQPATQPANAPAAPVVTANLVQLQLGKAMVTLEIADTPNERAQGLMFRPVLPLNEGMIFVFPDAQERGFWMKNTYIPLDIIYVGEDRRIISIKQMKPQDLSSTPSDGPAMYAIELNANRAAELGLAVGQVLDIPPAVSRSVR